LLLRICKALSWILQRIANDLRLLRCAETAPGAVRASGPTPAPEEGATALTHQIEGGAGEAGSCGDLSVVANTSGERYSCTCRDTVKGCEKA